MDSRLILERLYGKSARVGWMGRMWRRLRGGRRLLSRRDAYPVPSSRRNAVLVVLSLMASSCLLAHIYYYNRLIALYSRTQQTWAQVEALQQQRGNIQDSLTEISHRYSQYERDLLTSVTAMRAGTPPEPPGSGSAASAPTGGSSFEDLLSRIRIVAEEYPELRLGDTLNQLSNAMVTNESQITKAIMDHNLAVGEYSTFLAQFPASVFGHIAGFHPEKYYDPGDRRALEHRRITF